MVRFIIGQIVSFLSPTPSGASHFTQNKSQSAYTGLCDGSQDRLSRRPFTYLHQIHFPTAILTCLFAYKHKTTDLFFHLRFSSSRQPPQALRSLQKPHLLRNAYPETWLAHVAWQPGLLLHCPVCFLALFCTFVLHIVTKYTVYITQLFCLLFSNTFSQLRVS